MAVVGAAIGLLGACAARRVIGRLLFEISATDPITFTAGAALLVVVASIASGVQSRESAR